MILNTGQRTDIPAFYAEWFSKRLEEGFVCVRNPFHPKLVSRYQINPKVVDVIGFCTKNPAPMFPYMDLLKDYNQYWFMTLTPYAKDIEPNVPNKHLLIEHFKTLSKMVGIHSIVWRYDPIFISERYTIDYHLRAFSQIAEALAGYTKTVVISFIDLYPKVKRNFPEVKEVTNQERIYLGKEIIQIASQYGMLVKPCAEGNDLAIYGADCGGCMRIKDYEEAIGLPLNVPNKKPAREACACYLSSDIGAYNTCKHFCKYCYANTDYKLVLETSKKHDPNSPFLIGNYEEDDIIHDVEQKSWIDRQLRLPL